MTARGKGVLLRPVIRDRAGPLEPIPAAIAAITGQPLSRVVRVLQQCLLDLKGLAGRRDGVLPEDACHAAFSRFGYVPDRLYVDVRRPRRMHELLRAYANAPGPDGLLFVICENGTAHAFAGTQVSCGGRNAPAELGVRAEDGLLDMEAPVRYAFTVVVRNEVPLADPDHRFLETVAIPAFALAEAYGIEVLPIGWPYWNLSFPDAMTDGMPGSGSAIVCGEHELLSVINDRVRQHELAGELVAGVLRRLVGGEQPRNSHH